MSYQSKVKCDRCDDVEMAPQDGGFPFGWAEINIKPSLRGSEQLDKRKRLHLCAGCVAELHKWREKHD